MRKSSKACRAAKATPLRPSVTPDRGPPKLREAAFTLSTPLVPALLVSGSTVVDRSTVGGW